MKQHKTVDEYIENAAYWQDELTRLRKILNSTDLQETVKWGGPCYRVHGKNVVGMLAFKSYFGLWFFQGALLTDKRKVLINAQAGKTKALRQWRFKTKEEIDVRLVKAYVNEAIDLQKRGLEIKADRSKKVEIPRQLKQVLKQNKEANTSFHQLTKGKQREYVDYIADAKREETKIKRLGKIIPMIIAGKGLNDKYRIHKT